MTELGTYDGQDVLQLKAKVTKVGDGLSEALAIEPVVHHMGDEVYLVVKARVADHNHKPIKGVDGCCALILTFEGQTITVVAPDLVAEVIEAQEAKNAAARAAAERAKREARGEFDMDYQLEKDHAEGMHAAGPVDGCAQCELETNMAKIEALGGGDAAEQAGIPQGEPESASV